MARFDKDNIEFVAKNGLSNCNLNAGAFDNAGDLYVSCGSKYFKSTRPDQLDGYTNFADVPSSADMTQTLNGNQRTIADFGLITADFADEGSDQQWFGTYC